MPILRIYPKVASEDETYGDSQAAPRVCFLSLVTRPLHRILSLCFRLHRPLHRVIFVPLFFLLFSASPSSLRHPYTMESVRKSFGVIVNSFYGLEQVYADQYQKLMGRKAWHIGPVSLLNKKIEEKANRGNEASIDEQECLKWLDSKKPNSVLYICFGSIANFTDS